MCGTDRFQDRPGHIWARIQCEREDSIVTDKWATGVDLGDNWGLIVLISSLSESGR
jgi:hypothetical protein